ASNANFATRPCSGTGGSWKKSPVMMSCIPPKGLPLFRIVRAICSNLSNSSPSTMDTSSTINTLVR
ncbi:hypothetical protein DM02DRAFT_469891, partial [Periconia macrospinosa]